jgi:hypothetical protein
MLGLTPEDNTFANQNISAIQLGGVVAARANVTAPGKFTNNLPPGITIAKGQVDNFVRIEFDQTTGNATVIQGQRVGLNVLAGMGTELSAKGPFPGLPSLALQSGVVGFSRAAVTLQTSTPVGKLDPLQAFADPLGTLGSASVALNDPLAPGRVQTLRLQAAGETSFLGVGGQGILAKATVTLPSGKLFNADTLQKALGGDFAGVLNSADAALDGSQVNASLHHYNNTGSFGILGAGFETSQGASIKGEIEAHHGVRDMDDAPLWQYSGSIPQTTSGVGGWVQEQLNKVPPEVWEGFGAGLAMGA